MKRHIGAILMALVVAAFAAGCSDKSGGTNTAGPNANEGTVVAREDLVGSLWFATNRGVSLFTGIISAASPGRVVLMPNYPNPFNPATSIPFRLQAGAWVTADVVDCSGRRIRTLADGRFSPGSHTLTWSTSGDDVAGVYLLRVSAKGDNWTESRTQKCLLIK